MVAYVTFDVVNHLFLLWFVGVVPMIILVFGYMYCASLWLPPMWFLGVVPMINPFANLATSSYVQRVM